jgi:hypothetical protein
VQNEHRLAVLVATLLVVLHSQAEACLEKLEDNEAEYTNSHAQSCEQCGAHHGVIVVELQEASAQRKFPKQKLLGNARLNDWLTPRKARSSGTTSCHTAKQFEP